MIRTIIIDDEFLARKRLENLLSEHGDIKIVGEAKNVEEAIALIPSKNPDLIFLDVQMPDGSGFDVLSNIPDESYRHIIFATAYDTYALKAFGASAIDYLLKPFDEDRLSEALSRVRTLIELDHKSKIGEKIKKLMMAMEGTSSNDFIIKEDGYETTIPLGDIIYIETAGNYVMLHLEDRKHLYRSTMGSVEEKLAESSFLRVHRSYLINEKFIHECSYLGNSEYKFVLKQSTEIISSRSYKDRIVDYLKH